MSGIDWVVLSLTLLGIIGYGLYKSSSTRNLEGYFLSNRSMPWYLVLLSIMGTQASAITFLSAPGQAFTDGMRFVQYYFGLPLAMVVLCITFVPLFAKLKVFTAYEYLEKRFDRKTRTLTSFLFLLQRGLSTGISIYAPSIILSSLLGWNIFLTNIVMGGLLIIYTVTGGAKAVAYTQQLQLIIIFIGMFLAGYMIVHLLPQDVGFTDALKVSGALGKLNVITTGAEKGNFDWNDKYNMWSGVIGGFFLALSYFGTDQSQVGRYLTAKNTRESKLGLLINGLIKVPMQFAILLIGALLFSFYQFSPAPVFHNKAVETQALKTPFRDSLVPISNQYNQLNKRQNALSLAYVTADKAGAEADRNTIRDSLQQGNKQLDSLRTNYRGFIRKAMPVSDNNDTNYIFLRFVVDYLPVGLVGLLIAIIFLAAWGSIAAALNSLASCSVIDFHLRFCKEDMRSVSEVEIGQYKISKYYTLAWGVFSIIVAEFANRMGSLIEAVNILGSLFYGVILGIFLVAFYLKNISARPVFIAAIISEIAIITLFVLNEYKIIGLSFLWLNVAGALLVIFISLLLQKLVPSRQVKPAIAG
ncbi:sodium:solute symporter [Segetibacter sp. 3557_3]|uniref:sodium:solute symporter n=1 Tax=Segetibacter sp. 3557_3 TaxID=2547429 RepID=UPI001058B3F9|nr:sodium:solute symporter [Segetibacter sp. 3557_3]TDH28945.1 sodium:solute symporter [Segetibacter sp. 3557_3]